VAYLKVRVTPSAGRDALVGWQGNLLRIKVAAAPEKGRANEAVLKLLAAALELPSGALRIVRGASSRDKVILIDGLTDVDVQRRLSPAG